MSSEERLKVLKMVSDGILSIEEAEKLLDVLNESNKQEDSKDGFAPSIPGKNARWIRIVVSDVKTGKKKVNLRLPAKLIDAGVKIGSKFTPELDGVNVAELLDGLKMAELLDTFQEGTYGKIIDVIDDKDGEHVEISIE